MEFQDNITTFDCLKNYNEYKGHTTKWDADVAPSADVDCDNDLEVNEDDDENEIEILKENVQDIFDQLSNLELLVQSLHEKLDAIADQIL